MKFVNHPHFLNNNIKTFGNHVVYLIDSQMNLVKNGTFTEECLPYSSSNGSNTESCPLKCKNGDDLVFYHAKNAYTTEEDYNQENFYDIITVIIDQLITYGPVVSGIIVYDDFYDFKNNANCKNIIYKKMIFMILKVDMLLLVITYLHKIQYMKFQLFLEDKLVDIQCIDQQKIRTLFQEQKCMKTSFHFLVVELQKNLYLMIFQQVLQMILKEQQKLLNKWL